MDSALVGQGPSSWGIVPPPDDSVTGRFSNPGDPLWESTLLVPYRVARAPFQGLAWGAEQLVRLGVRSELAREVVAFFVEPRRVRVLPGFEAGGLSGTGGGLSVRADPFLWSGSRARGRAAATLPGDLRFHGGVLGPLGRHGVVEMGAGFRRRRNARFFGLGPDSRKSEESRYEREESWVGAGLSFSPWTYVTLESQLVLSRVGAFSRQEDGVPPLEAVFQELPAGFGRFSDGFTGSLSLAHRTATRTGRPTGGGVRAVAVSFFRSLDDEFSDHWAFRAEAQQFIGLVNEHQVLALRGFATWIDPTGASVVPFQRLVTNDAPDLLRGHEDFRFRDRGMAVLSAEYRWPLWVWARPEGVGVDAYLLTDVGQVFRSREDLAASRLSTSYGLGFRVVAGGAFLGLLEVARSEEGWVFRIGGEQIFRLVAGGLYDGRGRVPTR